MRSKIALRQRPCQCFFLPAEQFFIEHVDILLPLRDHSLVWEWPDALGGPVKNLVVILSREEAEMVAEKEDRVAVRELLEADGPVRSPHEAPGTKAAVDALHLSGRVGIRKGLRREGPHVRELDEDVR